MKNSVSKTDSAATYSNDSLYSPVQLNQLRNISFSHLTVGVEYSIYDSITNNHFTFYGKRISLKKEYETRVVIGCVECPEYMIIENEEFENTSLEDFVYNFLSLVNSKISSFKSIAA